jgi:hypothetical protein
MIPDPLLFLLKFAGPPAMLTGALYATSQGLGFPIGMEHVTGGVVAYLIIAKVLDFLSKRKPAPQKEGEAQASAERLEVQREIVDCLNRQTGILERMERSQASVLRITEQYAATGVCPLTRPIEREATLKAIGREAALAKE